MAVTATETTGIQRLPAARIDRGNPMPVYIQIAEALRSFLKAAGLTPGMPLPPERILSGHFGVSRMTLREAYGVLEREGVIERQRGKGTFVSARVRKQQQEMRSFTEEITRRGAVPSSKVLLFRTVKPVPAAKDFFALPEAELVYEIQRVRFGDRVPLALESVQIPCSLCPNLERFDLSKVSLYGILEQDCGFALARCAEEISARPPSRREKRLLELPAGVAVLVIERKTYTVNETPAELAKTTYRGDLYRAIVHSVRSR